MKLPSNKYFESVKTIKEYLAFYDSGMLFELEPNAPMSWDEHLKMLEFKKKKDYYDAVKGSNYKASLKLEGFEMEGEGFERSSN